MDDVYCLNNYFLNNDNPPDDAILGLYKLDDHLLGRCHLVKTDPGRFNTTNASVQGQVLYFDNNLNLLKTKQFSHTDVSDYRTFSKMSVARSRHGTLLVFSSKNLDNTTQHWTTVTKFPAEAFLCIDEAHDNGLKVAIAYPNPGKDELNIRTTVTMWQPYKVYVEIYDLSGRMVYNQEIKDNITPINTESWPSGIYVWKVYTDVEPVETPRVETGKWIKE